MVRIHFPRRLGHIKFRFIETVAVYPPRLIKIKKKKTQSPDPVGLDLGRAAAAGSAPGCAAATAPLLACPDLHLQWPWIRPGLGRRGSHTPSTSRRPKGGPPLPPRVPPGRGPCHGLLRRRQDGGRVVASRTPLERGRAMAFPGATGTGPPQAPLGLTGHCPDWGRARLAS